MLKYFALFTLVPVGELWLLIEVGKIIGTWPTILIVASTGFFGVILAKSQGLSVIHRLSSDMAMVDHPGEQLLDGACILVGGAFLLTPGLVTDVLGFSLLIPITRMVVKKILRRKMKSKMDESSYFIYWQ